MRDPNYHLSASYASSATFSGMIIHGLLKLGSVGPSDPCFFLNPDLQLSPNCFLSFGTSWPEPFFVFVCWSYSQIAHFVSLVLNYLLSPGCKSQLTTGPQTYLVLDTSREEKGPINIFEVKKKGKRYGIKILIYSGFCLMYWCFFEYNPLWNWNLRPAVGLYMCTILYSPEWDRITMF